MRDLTDEELALAPWWASGYLITTSGVLLFSNGCIFVEADMKTKALIDKGNISLVDFNSEFRDIPKRSRKSQGYVLSDENIIGVEFCNGEIFVDLSDFDSSIILNKDDVIVLAKMFGIKAEDLC